MKFLPVWSGAMQLPVLAILSFTIGFIAYWFLSQSSKLEERFRVKHGAERYSVRFVVFQRLAGFFFLGLGPATVTLMMTGIAPDALGVNLKFPLNGLWWALGLCAILIPVNLINGRRPANLEQYPQMRVREWSYGTVALSALTWIIYLLAYEFMFRGLLLFGTIDLFGRWPAIAINVCLYAVSHIPKGLGETLGAIPFGALICLITLDTGSIWVAVIAHVALALSNEWVSLRAHPDMHIKKS